VDGDRGIEVMIRKSDGRRRKSVHDIPHTYHIFWNQLGLGEKLQFSDERTSVAPLSDEISASFRLRLQLVRAILTSSSSLRRNAPDPFSVRRIVNVNANPTQLRFRYASPRPRPATLQTPEEIYIGKLLHLLHVGCLSDLLVVKEHP